MNDYNTSRMFTQQRNPVSATQAARVSLPEIREDYQDRLDGLASEPGNDPCTSRTAALRSSQSLCGTADNPLDVPSNVAFASRRTVE